MDDVSDPEEQSHSSSRFTCNGNEPIGGSATLNGDTR
jgi:hypothetical protein